MRLLRTADMTIAEFPDNPPPYVIMSHTWELEEVSLQEMQSSRRSVAESKRGFDKIRRCCQKAAQDGYQYAWVDTCCIDKTSSAELSEAINSMHRWYQGARICYAYLSDVPSNASVLKRKPGDTFDRGSLFKSSRWFTRGWTLQELIAPPTVEFYAADWSELGTKSSLQRQLSGITGIDMAVLGGTNPQHYNVAERLSWAAHRQTTRVEDRAYCLLGIFDVHMPLIYGEGKNAFVRLQEEILRKTEDLTIMAWDLCPALVKFAKAPFVLNTKDENARLSSNIIERHGALATEATRFFVGPGPHDWRYEDLKPEYIQPTDSSPLSYNTRHSPPSFTPRGLCLSVLVGVAGPLVPVRVAYMNYRYKDHFICMALSRSRSAVGPAVYHRLVINLEPQFHRGYYLATRDEILGFEPTTIYITLPPASFPSNNTVYPVQFNLGGLDESWNRTLVYEDEPLEGERRRYIDAVYCSRGNGDAFLVAFKDERYTTSSPAIEIVGREDRILVDEDIDLRDSHSPKVKSRLKELLASVKHFSFGAEKMDRITKFFSGFTICVATRCIMVDGQGRWDVAVSSIL